jgi:hypothetical protein
MKVKQLSRIAAAAALAGGALFASQASATIICTACSYNQATNGNLYVGALNSTTGDLSFVNSGNTANTPGAFSHTYVFDFAPIGSVASNLVFLPTSEISNFTLTLFSATSGACSPLAAGVGTGGCAALMLGAPIAAANNIGGFVVDLPFTAVPAGRYAVRVTGTVAVGLPNSGYSGQISTQNVPEPGSLALAGLAMVGAAFAARRARKA